MTTSLPSGSEELPAERRARESSSFALLHERLQRWVWRRGWHELRDAQEKAIASILAGERDVIIAAPTASGKTEAAFLPLLSRLVSEETHRRRETTARGVRVLYVGPLKALINDQFERLEELCEHLDITVQRWHGDVPSGRKRKVLEERTELLLITPESLEALFVIHGHRLRTLFASLEAIVADELHAYIGTERGRQLQSLLHRLEVLVERRVVRIGLSATLGDMSLAAAFLRPESPGRVEVIASEGDGQEILLQLRGYRVTAPREDGEPPEAADSAGPLGDEEDSHHASDVYAIARHIFKVLRGSDHLVFADSRASVERYADLLRRLSDQARVPNEFVPHHGSLSKEIREDAERRLKQPATPTTAVCTSTLELGIDIGQVTSVAEIGAPSSVSSLRQRLGRSGRRGDAAVLRLYESEPELTANSSALVGLRPGLVQTVAVVELLIERWCEPPEVGALHLSTLVQQVLSVIAQHGGVAASTAWQLLCRSGPFEAVGEERFASLLRRMGKADLITQAGDGTLVLGGKGERIVGHYNFYAVFKTPEESRLVHAGRPLGTMAYDRSLFEGIHLVFAGRRWRVVSVELEGRVVHVEPSPGGRMPAFRGDYSGLVHDEVRRKMRAVLESAATGAYLNREARKLLVEARGNYVRLGLDETPILDSRGNTLLFLCRGDRIMNTVGIQLAARGLDVEVVGPAITVLGEGARSVRGHLEALGSDGPADPLELAATVRNKARAKYDWVLDEALLCADYGARALDTRGAHAAVREIVG